MTIRPASPVARPATGRLRNFLRDSRGSVAVVTAILFPVVVGGMGLGAEAGYWYMIQRELQHAADVSVHAAIVRKRSGDDKDGIDEAALFVAEQSGFAAAIGTLVVNDPPLSGPRTGDANSIELLIAETRPRLFSALFNDGPVTLGARAVATVSGDASSACVLALSPTASKAVTATGSTTVNLTGCDVASNSNASDALFVGGAGSLTADCAYTVGEADTGAGLNLTQCAEVKEHAPTVVDPYAAVAEPTVTGTCKDGKLGKPNSTVTVTPTENHPSGVQAVRYCGGIDIKGSVTFEPGLYIVDGGAFKVTSTATIIGSGVTFYFANGAELQLNGNTTLQLSAPTSGPYSGLLFMGSRTATSTSHIVNGTSGSTITGAVYAPASHVQYSGNSGTGGCAQVIGNTITFTGNSGLESECETSGTKQVFTNQQVSIVE